MKLPPIDLSGIIILLKKEGFMELSVLKPTPKSGKLLGIIGMSPILDKWNDILKILELEIIPMLAKGCEAESLVVPAKKLANSAAHLSLLASEILSFVPGPIGIVCSLINAIGCFSTGNIVGGFFELLGCIPGGKVAGRGASKLFPKIEKHIHRIIMETSSKQQKVVSEFFQKYAPKSKPKLETGYGYGTRIPSQPSVLEESLKKFPNPAVETQREIGKYTTFPNTYGNMGKTNLWPHLS